MAKEFNIDSTFVCNIQDVLKNHNIEPFGKVQQVIDSGVIRYDDQYVPFDTGALKDSANIHTVIGSGEVKYETVYARNQYYIPHKHAGKRTDYWFEHMKQEGGKEKLLNEARRAVK